MLLLYFFLSLLFLGFFVAYLGAREGSTKRWLGIAAIVALLALCTSSLVRYEIRGHATKPSWGLNMHYGLDIQGGTQFVLELGGEVTESVRDQAVTVIRARIDGLGLTEPIIQPSGSNRIIVQIPGVSEEEKNTYRNQLQRVAKLEFRMVHPHSERLLNASRTGSSTEELPIDYEELPMVARPGKGPSGQTMLVKRRADMSGRYVDMAYRSVDELGRPVVIIEFTPEGSTLFAKLTRENQHERMAIILDREIYSAPEIRNEISGRCEISGGSMTPEAAEELANVLQNPLETPVQILDERSVDPSLGKASVESGFQAGLIALAAVIIFMILYYRTAGLLAVTALGLNMLILVGLLSQLGFTLTMPGLAGIVLTLGMAVDANVLIYERMREELDAGKKIATALAAGFNKAFSSILDANVTTLIAAVILFWQGSGSVQGFAVTLTLGVISSVFSAMVITRLQFEFLLATGKLKTLRMSRLLAGQPNFDFMRSRWLAMGISATLIAFSLLYVSQRGQKIYGIDFTGGSLLTYAFEQKIPDSAIQKALPEIEVMVQYMRTTTNKDEVMAIRTPLDKADLVEARLLEKFPQAKWKRVSSEKVDSVIGKELQKKAFVALALGLLGIFLYTTWRFESRFAVGAVVAVLHDVLLSLGLYALFGRQLSLPVVGAILTVAGYSINDTIVIFDRIREGLKHRTRPSLAEIMNLSINQTLSRTLITSGVTFAATLALFLFGGVVINDFAFILLIGIIVGTYSSIFIASPIALILSSDKEARAISQQETATAKV